VKLPHKVRLTARSSYEVVWVDRFDDPLQGGLCDEGKRTIYILKGMSEGRTLEVFIHEVFHALEFEWKIPLPHRCIEMLEGAVIKLLKLNGWMPKGKRG
jgi:hypothetical protein